MIHRFLLLLSSLLLVSLSLSAQPGPDVIFRTSEPPHPDTIFYPYYDNVQMIEIDQVGAWERNVALHEAAQPRALSWSMLIGGPLYNIYLFRHRNGTIVKAFNTSTPLDSLTMAFRRIPADRKPTGFRSLTNPVHRTRYHSGWGDYHSRMNDFGGYYLVYTDSSRPYNHTMYGFDYGMSHQHRAGMIDSLGNIFLPIEYSALYPAKEYILACKDSMWGLLDHAKREVVPMHYHYAAFDSQEEIIFSRNQRIQLIYDLRRNRFFPIDDAEEIATEQMRSDRYNPYQLKDRPALYPFRRNGLTGLMDSNYTVITPAVYQLIQWHVNGRALVCRNNLFGYLDEHGKEIIPCQYTYGEYFLEDIAVVQHEGKFRNIDKKGSLLETNKRSHESWRNNHSFHYNVGSLCAVETGTGMGLTGSDGVFVIPPIYESLQPLQVYSNGRYDRSDIYFEVKRFNKVGIMDTAGNLMLPIEYEMIGDNPGVNGFRMVKKDEQHWGVINRNFAVMVPCLYEGISIGYAETYFTFWKNNKCGTMDTNGRVIIPAIYRSIYPRQNGRMMAIKDSLYGFIDTLGNTIIPFRYKSIHGEFSDGLIGFQEGGKWGFMDSTGAVIIPSQYKEVRRFQAGITGVLLDDKWGFIDRKGKLVVEYQYDFVGHEWYKDGTCEVRQNGWIGFVNAKGKEVIPCQYQSSWGFNTELGHYLERNGKKEYVKAR